MMAKVATAIAALACASLGIGTSSEALAQKTIRAVMHSDVKILDPVWTGTYITRNHGYMIYDTLLARDANGEIKPQMLEKYQISEDKLIYTFTLRSGLLWHDGKPVKAEDCVASIRRWGAQDGAGQVLLRTLIESMEVGDDRTFTIKLKQPTAVLLQALSKPSSIVPFMMPKRLADTPNTTQISEFIGSGPFMMKQDEWRPGNKIVYVKFDKYKPRDEPASGLAGGKRVMVDRVEWIAMPDQQQAVNALLAGEIDYLEQPSHDLLPLLSADAGITLVNSNPYGTQFALRPNHANKPLDNPKIRHALWYAVNQQEVLAAAIAEPRYARPCKAFFGCGSLFETTEGMDGLLTGNSNRARELLKEAGYDGTPIVLMHPSDNKILENVGPVLKRQLERAGFVVDMQTMDWQTLSSRRTRRDATSVAGWNLFSISVAAPDLADPMWSFFNSTCMNASSGWPCDGQMERIRTDFARSQDVKGQKAIAAIAQKRAVEWSTYLPLGEYSIPIAIRKSIGGIVPSAIPTFWNLNKQ